MHHLAKIAPAAGLKELIAEVFPDNAPMLKVFENSGLRLATDVSPGLCTSHLRWNESLAP
jgi:hypothetical protein